MLLFFLSTCLVSNPKKTCHSCKNRRIITYKSYLRKPILYSQIKTDPARETLKQTFYRQVKVIKETLRYSGDRPLTNRGMDKQTEQKIMETIEVLEASNPVPNPLTSQAIELLQGNWKLIFSTAREITTLSSLPPIFQLQSVYQIIDLKNRRLENRAELDVAGAIKASVRVTGKFYPVSESTSTPPELQETSLDSKTRERIRKLLEGRRVNVKFQKRSFGIESIFGVPVKSFLETLRQVNVAPLTRREPSLDITYLEESFRIGRGGDGGIFVLERVAPIDIRQK
ncbi:hypothetical protein Gasu2_09970 [Galdieria sulphuraria]|uniref:Plastid-lipid associated protein PAP, putative n=1 Tax=Galdieria sulphuraria TaxID=130081 RepID=M2X4R2_GALSU|nr:plastid-lipid associated protein PAP, putative [Galdieria sulphuraria]EME31435.1 plastid-lipid associated protein PAP, putative [Galdieria sulphuraria]GJD06590.1 hypothetical protein Gasu2_09970 [Galdieria sulphuraria]|eukprot:XP_005707955.1 plastid-lipid associated protein PAP, putative [Galdieria sulphuraria]